jgi:hypothetical protein
MKLKYVVLVAAVLIVAGAAASYWYLNLADRPNREGGDRTFKVGFLPVT